MKVLFIHENTLGHGSYLPVFVDYFARHPDLGIEGEILNATPLPEPLAQKADATIRGLRRFGWDMHFARWRGVVSEHVRELLATRDLKEYGAIVVNTQSVALKLSEIELPLFVCLDATIRQLSAGKWFSDPPMAAIGHTLNAGLIQCEQALYERAAAVVPWSQLAASSVERDYRIDSKKIEILPPSLDLPSHHPKTTPEMPRALFMGGDFRRKGGDLLVEAYERSFKGRIQLEVVTESDTPFATRRKVRRGSPEWEQLWRGADLFVFPSRLETFGIVLIEALAFAVPIISSRAGAAEEILENGKAGLLLDELSAEAVARASESVFSEWTAAQNRAALGRSLAEAKYDLSKNAARLAALLHKGAA